MPHTSSANNQRSKSGQNKPVADKKTSDKSTKRVSLTQGDDKKTGDKKRSQKHYTDHFDFNAKPQTDKPQTDKVEATKTVNAADSKKKEEKKDWVQSASDVISKLGPQPAHALAALEFFGGGAGPMAGGIQDGAGGKWIAKSIGEFVDGIQNQGKATEEKEVGDSETTKQNGPPPDWKTTHVINDHALDLLDTSTVNGTEASTTGKRPPYRLSAPPAGYLIVDSKGDKHRLTLDQAKELKGDWIKDFGFAARIWEADDLGVPGKEIPSNRFPIEVGQYADKTDLL